MTALELDTRRRDGHLTVSVKGPISRHTLGSLREHLRHLFAGRPDEPVDIDLHDCTDIDIDGLLALDVAYSAARKHDTSLRLTHVPAPIARTIDQHNLAHLLADTAPSKLGNVTNRRAHSPVAAATAPDVPEADAYEQQLPVAPDDDQPDTAHPPAAETELPLEADPADVDEQRQTLPLDDEDDPDEATSLSAWDR